MTAEEISPGSFRINITPAITLETASADDWDAKQGLPDAETLRDILSRAEHGYCPHIDAETSEECGDEPEKDRLYCAWHVVQEEDRGEDTTLDGLREEIAGMEPTPARRHCPSCGNTIIDGGCSNCGRDPNALFVGDSDDPCNCCGGDHGRQMADGEHCSGCDRHAGAVETLPLHPRYHGLWEEKPEGWTDAEWRDVEIREEKHDFTDRQWLNPAHAQGLIDGTLDVPGRSNYEHEAVLVSVPDPEGKPVAWVDKGAAEIVSLLARHGCHPDDSCEGGEGGIRQHGDDRLSLNFDSRSHYRRARRALGQRPTWPWKRGQIFIDLPDLAVFTTLLRDTAPK